MWDWKKEKCGIDPHNFSYTQYKYYSIMQSEVGQMRWWRGTADTEGQL